MRNINKRARNFKNKPKTWLIQKWNRYWCTLVLQNNISVSFCTYIYRNTRFADKWYINTANNKLKNILAKKKISYYIFSILFIIVFHYIEKKKKLTASESLSLRFTGIACIIHVSTKSTIVVMEIVKIEGQRRNLYFGVTVESLYLFKSRTMTFNIYSILISEFDFLFANRSFAGSQWFQSYVISISSWRK